jgi:LysM repeat protein
MRFFREVIGGLIFAAITTFTVLGGIGLASIESDNSLFAPLAVAQITPPPTETLSVPSPVLPVPTDTPGPAFSPTPCTPPLGWTPVIVGPNDTLLTLASRVGTNIQAIMLANCLTIDSVFSGQLIYLPAIAPELPTAQPCGPPPGWIFYTVQPGDNLFRIGLRYGVPLIEMQRANCLIGTNIRVGQNLFVPPVAVITNTAPPPVITDTAIPTPSFTNTATFSPPGATDTSTSPAPTVAPTTAVAPTFTATATTTSTATATDTEEVEATPTDTPTDVPVPTDTPTDTPTDVPVPTDTPTDTPVPPPTDTETPTSTPIPTETPAG